jgi:hypothetical protein
MGFLKRRTESQPEAAPARRIRDVQATNRVLAVSGHVVRATAADQLESERDRGLWLRLERQADILMPIVEEIAAQAGGRHTPEAVRAGTLRAYPNQFDLANRVEYEVWKAVVAAMPNDRFEQEARLVEDQPTPTDGYLTPKLAFLASGRRDRGMPDGVIREPHATGDFEIRKGLGLNRDIGVDERECLRTDILLNTIEELVQEGIAAKSAAT